jgi:hypothetical protein
MQALTNEHMQKFILISDFGNNHCNGLMIFLTSLSIVKVSSTWLRLGVYVTMDIDNSWTGSFNVSGYVYDSAAKT